MREEEMKEIRLNEINTSIHTDTRQQTLGGIKCPMTVSTAQAIVDMSRGAYNYLQFKIELQEEQIHLVKAANIELHKLPAEIPDDHARLVAKIQIFHDELFRFLTNFFFLHFFVFFRIDKYSHTNSRTQISHLFV